VSEIRVTCFGRNDANNTRVRRKKSNTSFSTSPGFRDAEMSFFSPLTYEHLILPISKNCISRAGARLYGGTFTYHGPRGSRLYSPKEFSLLNTYGFFCAYTGKCFFVRVRHGKNEFDRIILAVKPIGFISLAFSGKKNVPSANSFSLL